MRTRLDIIKRPKAVEIFVSDGWDDRLLISVKAGYSRRRSAMFDYTQLIKRTKRAAKVVFPDVLEGREPVAEVKLHY